MSEISLASSADTKELTNLINSAYRGETSRQGWTTEADLLDGIRTDEESLTDLIKAPTNFMLKYSKDKKILACVLLEKHDVVLYLGMLTVSPQLQGKGIGKQLLKAAEQKAREVKCNKIEMTVISVREELIEWYIRHGYIPTGKKKPFPMNDPKFGIAKQQLDFIVMEKEIKETSL